MPRKTRKERCLKLHYWCLVLSFCLTPLVILSFLNTSGAVDYPTKPIQIIVAFPPGGGADVFVRMVVNKLSSLLGQPAIVVNKPGGGCVIGTTIAMNAPPDGYTILSAGPPALLAPIVTKGVTFNLTRDFTPINLSVNTPILISVKKDAPWTKLEELIAEAKKNPGKLTCSTSGVGTTLRFALELFKIDTSTDITHVPMEGAGPAVMGVLGGHTNFTTAELGVVHKYLQAGSLRALVVMAKKRHKDFPDVPTTVEKGFPTLITSSWHSFVVPVKTPREIVEKLDKVFKEALSDREVIEMLEKAGWVLDNLGSKEAGEFIAKDQQKKLDVAKAINLIPQ